ncbi:hypothetical protein DFH06DRAFT_974792 [Mycena polygramma]|nr:hypothetical protein DFH06DRAFT_974792 [Mycena polygramma]
MSSAEDSSSAPSSSVFPLLPSAIPSTPRASTSRTDDASESPLVVIPLLQENDEDESDAGLLRAYNVPGADASDLLGYDDEDSDEEDGDGDENGSDSDDGPEDMDAYRRGIRVAAANRAEGNRREGGRRTQSSMVKMWNEFTGKALKAGKIEDHTVDEHSLLLYINFCAERPKRTPKGIEKPGTFLGASQLKKLFFGALRIRKLQDAADPSLAKKRPATSVIVYDSIKTRMDEALERERNGLSPEEDAPDIRANTWLSQVTEQQLKDIGFGFLSHRQLRLAVWGHLAWTAQHASGNRGDDFRALKLAELQPTTLKHPDKRTEIYSVLGLQGEEKAGRRGMKTVINPSYSVFIANIKPEMCPLGGFAFYFHYIYDEKKIVETLNLDYTINKSWRAVRVLHGPKSPTTPFNEGNLYNLYCKAYAHAGFKSRLKAHLPRHLLGYRQQELGVDPLETSKLGWVRGQTYMDTYAPALPKTESLHISAILGAAGYQVDEIYDPTWRRVRVPEAFLRLVCPMAEEMLEKVAGMYLDLHLSGAFNHWEMAIELREYFFQCGAAIWQLVPGSAIFRLPAFQGTDVRNWMTTGYPAELSALDAATGSPVEMERIQNAALQRSLLAMRSLLTNLTVEVRQLRGTVDRRTAIFTPARGFSASVYQRNGKPHWISSFMDTHNHTALAASEFLDDDGPIHNPGTIVIPSGGGSASSRTTPPSTPPRSVARSSPLASSTTHSPRLITQVELVLPPLAAFYQQGAAVGIIHPILGMQSARWVEDVFPAIRQPHMCWSVWGPAKTMDQFEHVREIWDIYAHGERTAVNSDGTETHMKPPLKLVEQFFKHKWRTSLIQQRLKKAWERFREIPEWIDQQSTARRVAPDVIIAELEEMRARDDGSGLRGINWLVQEVASRRKQDKEVLFTIIIRVQNLTHCRRLPLQHLHPILKRRAGPGPARPKKEPPRRTHDALDPVRGRRRRLESHTLIQ